MNGFLAWLHGVIAAAKPLVSAFLGNVGAMLSNRQAPAGEVALSAIVLLLLVLYGPKALKKITK